jgi:hypothetical protein
MGIDMFCLKLQNSIKNEKQSLTFLKEQGDGCMSNLVAISWNKSRCLYIIFFCPWDGEELEQAFTWNLREKLHDNGVANAYLDEFDFETQIPSNLTHLKSKQWWDNTVLTLKTQHGTGVCSILEQQLNPEDAHGIPLKYFPNIRAYAILNKKKYGGFEPMDYCPFCGAKFPERLDAKLTEVLRSEYGLKSWEDYKKAPHEFHTDEWWRKRGL